MKTKKVDPNKKEEMFGSLRKFYRGTGMFAMRSLNDIREAGREAGKALKRI